VPIRVPVPTEAFAEYDISLAGVSYLFTYRYNERLGRWKLDISTPQGDLIIAGMSLIEGVSPNLHLVTEDFPGSLFVVRFNETPIKASRDNLGIGKDYELVYFTEDEEIV